MNHHMILRLKNITIPKFWEVFIFAVLIFADLILAIFVQINWDNDEVNDEEEENYVENKEIVEDASNMDLYMGEECEGVIELEVREENTDNKFLKTGWGYYFNWLTWIKKYFTIHFISVLFLNFMLWLGENILSVSISMQTTTIGMLFTVSCGHMTWLFHIF